jgi:DNA helicase-2/ATP-dependent DNA helicase PcrA
MLESRSTIKVRSSGRAFMRAGADHQNYGRGYGRSGGGFSRGATSSWVDDLPPRESAASRRPGLPVTLGGGGRGARAVEDESQDAAVFAVGARVRHRKFGTGTIAELSGGGRDAKVKIDFDDEAIGRKTLVIAQANLERGDE